MPALGCSSHPAATPISSYDLAWPAAAPRVRLDSVISLAGTRQRAGGELLRRLTGDREGVFVARPFGAAWDGDDILVTDAGTGRLLRVTPRGRLAASAEGGFESPVGIAACSGRIVVADSRSGLLVRVDRDLRPAEVLLRGLLRPTAVACADDHIWVLETGRHRVLAIDASGQVEPIGERGAGAGQFNFPTALALNGDSLWVGDTLNFRVQRLDPISGRPLESFGQLGTAPGEMPRMKGIAVDSTGHLWISDAHLDQVALFSPSGDYLMSIGGLGTGPGRFSFPAGIAAHPDGRVAVVDSLNRRIQVFRVIGSPPGGLSATRARSR